MTLASSPRGYSSMVAFPRSLSTILVSVGGLAMFLFFASLLLVSNPIGSTFHLHFNSFDKKLDLSFPSGNQTFTEVDVTNKNSSSGSTLEQSKSSIGRLVDNNVDVTDKYVSPSDSSVQVSKNSNGSSVDMSPISTEEGEAKIGNVASDVGKNIESHERGSPGSENESADSSHDFQAGAMPALPSPTDNATQIGSVVSGTSIELILIILIVF